MGSVPRTGFRRGLADLYGYLDAEIPLGMPRSGSVFYVCNRTGANGANSTGNGGFDSPYLTIAYALTQCLASRGDVIVVKEGHAETLADAVTLQLNVAGVHIIGLGDGIARPTITIGTATTATIAISADGVTLENVLILANFLSIAAAITIASAKGVRISRCEFRDTSSTLNFLNAIKCTGGANTVDGLVLTNNSWFGLGTTSVNSFLLSANTIDRLKMLYNLVVLARTATAAIMATISAGILTNLDCCFNTGISLQTASTGGGFINVGGTTSSGRVEYNHQQTATTTTDLLFTTTVGLAAFENRVSGVIGAQGFVIPAADS